MARLGKNIYKRNDGRYEGRYIKGRDMNGKAIYGYVFAKTSTEIREKLASAIATLEVKASNLATKDTLCGILAEYIRDSQLLLKPSTCSAYERYLEKNVKPFFKDVRCDRLTEELMQDFVNRQLENGLSVATVQSIFSFVKAGIKTVPKSVFKVKFPKYSKKEIEIFSIEEQKSLETAVSAAEPIDHIGVMLSLYTGIRIGELCGLMWDDIVFERQQLNVNRTVQRVKAEADSENKTKVDLLTPKSESSVRSIPLQKFIIEMMKEHRSGSSGKYVLTCGNNPVEPRIYQRRFNKLLKSAGLRELNFHALRHTFSTRALEKGVDYKTLSELLGHASPIITMKTYAHSLDEHKRMSMEALACLHD
ncbi:site-specific integrase [Clostridia bacterium]|nr:site-specific integrase [Clostridia bacterium]